MVLKCLDMISTCFDLSSTFFIKALSNRIDVTSFDCTDMSPCLHTSYSLLVTPSIRVLPEKLTDPQLFKKFPVFFMKPVGSLPHSQEPATCPYSEPHRSSPCLQPTSWRPVLILSSHLRLGLLSGLLLLVTAIMFAFKAVIVVFLFFLSFKSLIIKLQKRIFLTYVIFDPQSSWILHGTIIVL